MDTNKVSNLFSNKMTLEINWEIFILEQFDHTEEAWQDLG